MSTAGPICIQHTNHSKANICQLYSKILAKYQKIKQLTTNICQLYSKILAKYQKVKQLTTNICELYSKILAKFQQLTTTKAAKCFTTKGDLNA